MEGTTLDFDAPLISTRRMKKTAVSVRRNMPKMTDDDSKTSQSLSVPVLDQVSESASVPFKCPLEKAVAGDLTRLQSSKGKQLEEAATESEDDDDVFSDALDTLSVKDSVSGGVDSTKLRVPPEDPQSRDFMLNRFLPAAKSMTVEQLPQYAFKRQPLPLISETMRQVRDIVPAENRATPKRYESVTTPPYYHHGIDEEDSEEYDDDDDEVSEYLSKRGCGMMSPQLCFKNSLGMMTSVNGLKEKPYSLRTPSHDHAKSSKVAQLKSRFQSVKKLALGSMQKLGSRPQSPSQPSIGKKYNFGFEQFEANLSTTPSRPSSPYRQAGCMSPYRSVGNISPLHPAGFPGTRKEAEIMRANRLNKHIRNVNKPPELLFPKSTRPDCSTSSVIEKTLHVDTENCPNNRNHQGNSHVKILPGIVETVSEEQDMTGSKQKAILEPQAIETPSINSGIKMEEADELKKNDSGCVLSPLTPPPPKKPSDSWLFRNLPSRGSLFHSRKKSLEENSTSVTKWETIVKTSCIHRDHIRYSEELGARSSCQSNT